MSIEVRQLEKTYGDFSLSLDFSVSDGETLILAGPSGCGKTTALSLIAGLIQGDRGAITIDGKSVESAPPWKRNIAVVFQDLALFPHLDVGRNVTYGLFIRGIPKAVRRAAAAEKLKTVRLSGYERRRIQTLSGGEKQRAAIARALAQDPRALLLDEPFSSLDAPLRKELREEFLEIRKQSPVPCIFVTHDREEAAMLGDRIALMSQGSIAEIGKSRDLFLEPKTEFAARFFGFGQLLPCRILEGNDRAVAAETPLGRLRVRDISSLNPEKPLLFVPRDALGFEENGRHGTAVSGIIRKSLFQGERILSEVELQDKTLLAIEADPRMELPPEGSKVRLRVDESLIRFVQPTA
ncbi:ABC transporter ATP-binding protein [Breznakiella homolactica]|uniref:ABC transporter ATP-binding protein n=1 Tax=Breznakiella homolactica TaxID=2798577 RepID=A0A7T7XKK7_9SPIR|nr:ABC transporter ATP-binding protein [Breznakiella homolactica]QQO08066.1 ABC transporter ATP-binding protein [Breznakiella homolactica]